MKKKKALLMAVLLLVLACVSLPGCEGGGGTSGPTVSGSGK